MSPMNERPRKVTYAGWMAAVACALVVLSLFDSMARLRSVETQQAVRDALARGGWTGVDVDQVLSVMHALVLLSGALAAAGAVLAVFTLQRHRGARVGLTVVAVLLVLSSWATAGLMPLLVVVAVVMLWSRESRSWFDGRQAAPQASGPPTVGPAGEAGPARSAGPEGPPTGTSPWQSPPAQPPVSGPVQGPPPGAPGPRAAAPGPVDPWLTAASRRPRDPQPHRRADGDPDRRPAAVAVAAWLTWVFCTITAVCFVLVLALVIAAPEQLLSGLQGESSVARLDLSGDDLLAVLWVSSAVVIFWSLAAVALAVLAYRRVRIAQLVLVVSAVLSGVVGLVAVPVGWLNAVAALVSAVLLCLPASRRWFARRGRSGV